MTFSSIREGWHKILCTPLRVDIGSINTKCMNKTIFTLLAGVVLGILIAPDKGSETLKKLRSRAKDYSDDAADKVKDLAGKGKEALRNGRSQLSEALD
jgi:gas vesicle protein